MSAFILPAVAAALGGEVKSGRYVAAPGPGHSHHDRSLKIWIEADRVCCSTYSPGDSWADCMDHVRVQLGMPAFQPGRKQEAARDSHSPQQRLDEALASWRSITADRRGDARYAARIWNEAVDPSGTPAEDYLAGRNLRLLNGMAMRMVRYHPACSRSGERLPALIVRFAPIVHPAATTPQAQDPPVECVQRIYLDPAKPKGHDGKWLLGHPFDMPRPELRDGLIFVPASRPLLVMKLSGDEDVAEGLHIAEGLESGLAAMHFGFRPLWAVYSAKAIDLFPPMPLTLSIMADQDRIKPGQDDGAGQLAARRRRQHWRKAHRWHEQRPWQHTRMTGETITVEPEDMPIHIPETPGDDWADAWTRHCHG